MGHDAEPDGEPIAERYTLDRAIGAGAAAVVYEGRDLAVDRAVAVKVYRQGGGSTLSQNREIEALARLHHENLVTLYDGGTENGPDGRTYLVTDLVEGPTLAARLREGPLSARSVRDLAGGLASALAHVHAGGFIHRDIKPANILLERGSEPRLADFGIAKALDGTVATATGAISGTAAYLAPEQVRGQTVEAAADVYALGLVLLESLTGRREYPGSAIESATARLYRRPAVPAGLPWNLTALLESMTDLDPAARPTARAVAAALNYLTAREPARKRRAVPALIAAALLLACLVGGASLFLANSGDTSGPTDEPTSSSPLIAADPLVSTVPGAEPLTPPPADDVVVEPSAARPASAAANAVDARAKRGVGASDNGAANDNGKGSRKAEGGQNVGPATTTPKTPDEFG